MYPLKQETMKVHEFKHDRRLSPGHRKSGTYEKRISLLDLYPLKQETMKVHEFKHDRRLSPGHRKSGTYEKRISLLDSSLYLLISVPIDIPGSFIIKRYLVSYSITSFTVV